MAGQRFFMRVRTLDGQLFDSQTETVGKDDVPPLDELKKQIGNLLREATHGVLDVTDDHGLATVIPFHAVASIQFVKVGDDSG